MPGGVAEEGIPERGETGTALQRASSPQGPEENYGQDFEVDEETGVPDGPHIVALGNSSHQISHHISTRQAHHAQMNQARNAFTEQALYSNSLPEMAFMRLPYSNQNPELVTSSVDECVESAVLRCLDCNFGERKLLCSTHDRRLIHLLTFTGASAFVTDSGSICPKKQYWTPMAASTITFLSEVTLPAYKTCLYYL